MPRDLEPRLPPTAPGGGHQRVSLELSIGKITPAPASNCRLVRKTTTFRSCPGVAAGLCALACVKWRAASATRMIDHVTLVRQRAPACCTGESEDHAGGRRGGRRRAGCGGGGV